MTSIDERHRIAVEVSAGELLDKVSILEIKSQRMRDPAQLAHVRAELEALAGPCRALGDPTPEVAALRRELSVVNARLWEIEDEIRLCDRRGDFGAGFVALARLVYETNDRRAELKRRLNEALGSRLVEQKCYAQHRPAAGA
jgi:hypothetical protein